MGGYGGGGGDLQASQQRMKCQRPTEVVFATIDSRSRLVARGIPKQVLSIHIVAVRTSILGISHMVWVSTRCVGTEDSWGSRIQKLIAQQNCTPETQRQVLQATRPDACDVTTMGY